MKNLMVVVAMVLWLALFASAGTVSGKVTGVNGQSVVYIDAISGKTFPAPAEHPVLSQKNLMFQPHLAVVQQGTTIDFLNADSVTHNIFWPAIVLGAKKFPGKNLGTWPQGEKRSFKFDQSGIATLLCNVHSEMSGFVIVVPTPYFALTDETGNYKIENIPDGQYTIVGWHEGSKPQPKSVTVSGDSKADLALSK
jgi:plastocyanin